MKDVIMWVLVMLVILLSLLLALTLYQNHRLHLEIDGWSDQVMELERMLEDGK